jgi:hypothetical protein
LKEDPQVSSFTEDIWGKGEKASFIQVLKGEIAGRAGRGKGRGHAGRDEY